MNPNLAFEGQGTAALVKLGRLQKVNKTNPNLTPKGYTAPRSLMATEEASLFEAETSGTAYQPRNNEDFNELGINMIDSDVVGRKKRKKRVKSDQVSFICPMMSLSINID